MAISEGLNNFATCRNLRPDRRRRPRAQMSLVDFGDFEYQTYHFTLSRKLAQVGDPQVIRVPKHD